ncbi:replication protein A subunit RPA32 [Coniophora puteana RWD-64-598 SS2]|uniref:Replication protein A subunit RPA32 n=1 Tax=Coniophora puteana (strain RWD-64-598) TaxID=741705 RepID=A0A5M3MPT9_CONPW|nr:replication protein A subunit RPA32 [Coniophora puteana RWD-64-598 SS2]EIW81143.1 replication protein A subunit RPA32 [Coniophora puteana RWD-64-598 SS2]
MSQADEYGGGYSPYGSVAGNSGVAGRVCAYSHLLSFLLILLKRSDVSHSLRPLTISQLLNATQAHSDAEWMLEDMEIGHVTCVAHVVSVQNQATNHVYELDDGTGRIEARHQTDSSLEEDADKEAGIKQVNIVYKGTYVRVLGNLKMFGSTRYINVNHIRPAKSADEIDLHPREAVTPTMMRERGPVKSHSVAQSDDATQSHGGALIDSQWAHLSELNQNILQFIKDQPATEEGVDSAAILGALETTALALDQALEQLMNDGLIYSTVDESHFQLTQDLSPFLIYHLRVRSPFPWGLGFHTFP